MLRKCHLFCYKDVVRWREPNSGSPGTSWEMSRREGWSPYLPGNASWALRLEQEFCPGGGRGC